MTKQQAEALVNTYIRLVEQAVILRDPSDPEGVYTVAMTPECVKYQVKYRPYHITDMYTSVPRQDRIEHTTGPVLPDLRTHMDRMVDSLAEPTIRVHGSETFEEFKAQGTTKSEDAYLLYRYTIVGPGNAARYELFVEKHHTPQQALSASNWIRCNFEATQVRLVHEHREPKGTMTVATGIGKTSTSRIQAAEPNEANVPKTKRIGLIGSNLPTSLQSTRKPGSETFREFRHTGVTENSTVLKDCFFYRSEVTGPQGARYELFVEKHHTQDLIKRAKLWLRCNFDVVQISLVHEHVE